MKWIAILMVGLLALADCANMPVPDGYTVKVLDDSIHHPPATHYLSLGPDHKNPSRPPIRDESELVAWWRKAAEYKCQAKPVIVIYGPELVQTLPEYCTSFMGEADCGSSVFGYLHCGR